MNNTRDEDNPSRHRLLFFFDKPKNKRNMGGTKAKGINKYLNKPHKRRLMLIITPFLTQFVFCCMACKL